MSSWVDKLGGRLAIATSQKLSRRDYLSRAGLYLAGLAGVTFSFGVVTQSAFGDTAPCTFKNDCGLTADNCGMGNLKYCAKFKGSNKGGTNATCKDCDVNADGCPKNTTKGTSSWAACCACQEANGKGHRFLYWDCCGTLDAECSK